MTKKMFTLALVALLLPMSMMAQAYKSSRYYNKNTGRLEYSNSSIMYQPGQNYYGLRLGPASATIKVEISFKKRVFGRFSFMGVANTRTVSRTLNV